MAISITARSEAHDTTGAVSYATTASFTPGANSLMIAAVWAAATSDPTDPTSVSGNGATYAFVNGITRGTDNRMSIWVADSGGSPSNGTITASGWGTNRTGCHIQVSECTGMDLGLGALGAIIQSVTRTQNGQVSGSVTLAAATDAGNRPYSCWERNLNEATNQDTSWTELDDQVIITPNEGMETQWRSDAFDTSAGATWTTNSNYAAIAMEIAVAGSLTIPSSTNTLRTIVSPLRW